MTAALSEQTKMKHEREVVVAIWVTVKETMSALIQALARWRRLQKKRIWGDLGNIGRVGANAGLE